MKIIYVIVIVFILSCIGYVVFRKIPLVTTKPPQATPAKITAEQAVKKVKNLPEVKEYLKNVPHGIVEVDNAMAAEYFVHVYEIKDGHTATFQWYNVDNKTGEVVSDFPASGTVSGRLCYPSDFLPKGQIEAKRVSDGYIQRQDYPGSLDGGKNTYSIQLEEGDYYLRYKISDQLIGYHTSVCPTGNEEKCGDTNQRILVKTSVKADEAISNHDLCDFYYQDANAPQF